MSKLETAKTYAGLEIIGKLAQVLHVDPHDFLLKPLRKSASKR